MSRILLFIALALAALALIANLSGGAVLDTDQMTWFLAGFMTYLLSLCVAPWDGTVSTRFARRPPA